MSGYDPEHVRGSVVVVPVHRGRFALLRRGPTDPWLPGRWNFPGGGIDPGETPRLAASRELAEEAGYLVPPSRLRGVGVKSGPGYRIHVFWFEAPHRGVRFPDLEHDAARWVTPRRIGRLPTIPHVADIARAVSGRRHAD